MSHLGNIFICRLDDNSPDLNPTTVREEAKILSSVENFNTCKWQVFGKMCELAEATNTPVNLNLFLDDRANWHSTQNNLANH